MNGFNLEWILYILGGVLLLAEIVIPGGVVGLLGLNAIITGFLVYFGLLESIPAIFLTWFGLSLGSYLAARPTLTRLLGGETSYRSPVEELDSMDQIVEVIETINADGNEGRIKVNGISWQATCIDGVIEKGSFAMIKYRNNLTYVVEKIDQLNYKTGL